MGTWTVPTPEIDEEARAGLRRAAKLAGDTAPLPDLEKLVVTYLRDRA
jgi:hypothetical protein